MFASASLFRNASAGGGGAPAFPLDGKSPTGAWSMFRDLLSSFVGGTRYTTATGVNSLNDQTGNGRHFQQATTTLQPAVTTAGPNSKTCLDFDGTDDVLINLSNQSNFITNNASFIVISCLVDTISTDNAGSPSANCCVFGDPGGYTGLVLRSTGPSALAYNFDGNYDATSLVTIATATPLVLAVRHDSGTLYVSKNGGTEGSVASGNTGDLAYKLQLGRSIGAWLDGKIFEIATFSTVPDSTTRAAIIADFMSQIGAT